jgi:hypothetical protein
MDIPIIDGVPPSPIDRLMELQEWAESDRSKLSAAFLAYENEGEDIEDYLFQVGYIKHNCLVTNKTVIEETGSHCVEYRKWKEYAKVLFEIQCHMELYYAKVKVVPPWGTRRYIELEAQGFTPRVLEGPHKGAGLRPNQKRKVILDASNDIVFGPVVS